MSAIGYLVTALAAALLPLLFVVAVNVIVDPYDELGHRFVPQPLVQVAQAEKLRMFEALLDKPQAIVFGSSRMMEIDPALFHQTGFNLAVNSALPEDFLAQAIWLSGRDAVPQKAFIGVDFDVFNPAIATDPRLLATRFLYRLIEHIPEVKGLASAQSDHRLISRFWRKYFSRRMFADSKRALEANMQSLPTRWAYLPNGLLMRRADLEKRAREGWSLVVSRETFAGYAAEKFSGYEGVSRPRMSILERTLQRLSDGGSQITVVLTPYHPAVLRYIEEDAILKERLREVRARLLSLSVKYGGKFIDATDISAIPCHPTEMWDVVHLMPECAERFAFALLKPY